MKYYHVCLAGELDYRNIDNYIIEILYVNRLDDVDDNDRFFNIYGFVRCVKWFVQLSDKYGV